MCALDACLTLAFQPPAYWAGHFDQVVEFSPPDRWMLALHPVAFVAWVVYACYLHARSTPSVSRRVASWIAVAGWATMLINLFGVNLVVSGLHSYAGV